MRCHITHNLSFNEWFFEREECHPSLSLPFHPPQCQSTICLKDLLVISGLSQRPGKESLKDKVNLSSSGGEGLKGPHPPPLSPSPLPLKWWSKSLPLGDIPFPSLPHPQGRGCHCPGLPHTQPPPQRPGKVCLKDKIVSLDLNGGKSQATFRVIFWRRTSAVFTPCPSWSRFPSAVSGKNAVNVSHNI